MITGNYTFFNILTIALMIPVWEDDFAVNLYDPFDPLSKLISWYGKSIQMLADSYWGKILLRGLTWAFIAWTIATFVEIKDHNESPWWTGNQIKWKFKWRHISYYMPDCCIFAIMMVLTHVVYFTLRSVAYHRRRIAVIKELALGSIAIAWILLSSTQLRGLTNNQVVLPPPLHETLLQFESEWSSFRLVSSYGLFRHMTGVSNSQGQYKDTKNLYVPALVSRPEIVIEGLDAASNDWREVDFLHKPGNTLFAPTIVAPHQPRLDWQMWFAALGNYQGNTWLVHLVYKLLEQSASNSTVLSLINQKTYPFHGSKPKAIRVTKYEYDFTRWNTPWARSTPFVSLIDSADSDPIRGNSTSPWYSRIGGSEYLPVLESGNPSIVEYLKSHGLEPRRTRRPKSKSQLYRDCIKRNDETGGWWTFAQRLCCKSLQLLEVIWPSPQVR